jgi:hypothetical protein
MIRVPPLTGSIPALTCPFPPLNSHNLKTHITIVKIIKT